MKKIAIIAALVLASSFAAPQVHAAVVASAKPFDVSVRSIADIKGTDLTRFLFDVSETIVPGVSYWKIRTYCDDRMTVRFAATTTDACGTAVRFDSFASGTVSFLYDNEAPWETKQFSIKVKGYDANGKWMHTETERFRWK